MTVDSSAIIAMIMREPEHEDFLTKILTAETLPKMSAANYLESAIVVDGRNNPTASRDRDTLIDDFELKLSK